MFEFFFSFFITSFFFSSSSLLSGIILLFFSSFVMMLMHWYIMSSIPLFLFSLFLVGGMYILIGFVMMGDENDLKSIFFMKNYKESIMLFMMLFISSFFLKVGSNFSSLPFMLESSFVKEESSYNSIIFSGTYFFLVFILLIFLFIIFLISKKSMGGGGLIN